MRPASPNDAFRRDAARRRARHTLRLQGALVAALLLVIGAFRFTPVPAPPPSTISLSFQCLCVPASSGPPLPLRPPRPIEVADSVDTDSLRARPLDFDVTLDVRTGRRPAR